MKKLLCLLLALCLCLSMGTAALASGEASGGDRGADSSYPTFDETVDQAAISIDHAAVQTVNDDDSSWTSFAGTLEIAEGGSVTDKALSGVYIAGADYSAETEDSDTDNGIAWAGAEDMIMYIGGTEDFFDVEVGGETLSFNSVIILKGEELVDDAVEGDDGVGVLMDEGNYLLENLYIETDGMRAPAIYNMNADSVVVVDNCFLNTKGGESWHPLFTLLTASTRAALLFGGETWFYNDTIVTQDWGCLSQEGQNDGTRTWAVNTYLEAYCGGYGAYVLNDNYMDFYGTEIQATDYAIFLCGHATAVIDDLAAGLGDETVAANMEEFGVTVDEAITEDGKSIIAANINAIVVHTNGVADGTASCVVANSIVTTDTAHGLRTVGATGEEIGLDISFRWTESDDDTTFNQGESWFAMENMWGSAALVRSMQAELTFDNTEIYPSNGVLLQSIVAYDPNGGTSMYRAAGEEALEGISATFANGAYTGDILHQDYHRQMTVTLENAALTGSIQSYTMQMWNDLWSTENLTAMLEAAGLDTAALTESRAEAIRAALIVDESYDGDENKTGVNLYIDGDSTWTVTATSSLGSLTVESADALICDGAYTIYVNCDTSSDLSYYDTASGQVIDELEPGVTYTDVVILVEGASGEIG